MPPLTAAFFVLMLISIGIAGLLHIRAHARLSQQGEEHPTTTFFLGVFAPETDFTPEGWRLHTRSTLYGLAGIVFLALTFWSTRW